MDPSDETKDDGHQISYMIDLPMELHLRIRNHIRKDPDIPIAQLRTLRLVCKKFDDVWRPAVIPNLMLLPKGPDGHLQLRYLVDGKEKTYSDAYTSVTIQNLHSVEKPSATKAKDIYSVNQAKQHVASLHRKLDLPNVRHAKLLCDHKESEWSITQSAKILLSLKNLTELELAIQDDTDMKLLLRCLEPLTGLHKLTLLPSKVAPLQARSIGNLIARNESLTHFTCYWHPTNTHKRIDPFGEVPSEKPLKLEHISLNGYCTNIDALLPHIQTLTSAEFHTINRNTWCPAFTTSKVFPPTLKVDCVDSELVAYIGAHTKIINLTVSARVVKIDTQVGNIMYPSLFKALENHCGSLKYLFVNTRILPAMLQTAPERMAFLRCVIDLQEIVLLNDKTAAEYPGPDGTIRDEKRVLPVISLGRKLTLRIRSKDRSVYTRCVEHCRSEVSNPMFQDLIARIVYENPDQ